MNTIYFTEPTTENIAAAADIIRRGGLLGIPAGFAAALGLVCVFCGAVNCPIASMVLSIELFGAGQLVYFALACGIAYMLSGYFGLYSSQKILYSKLRTEFINIHAK